MRRMSWLLLMASCTPPPSQHLAPDEPAVPAPPTASAPAASAPVASAAPPSAPPSVPAKALPVKRAPLPKAPPGTDPELVRIAGSICAAAYSGKSVGCRSHPPFVRPEQVPDGEIIEHRGDPLLFCAIDGVFRGAFSKPGARQALVSFAQCKESEEAVWDAGFPGSAVLVEEEDGRYNSVDFEDGLNLGACLSTRQKDGHDVLLCESGLGAPPAGDVSYFFVVDFARRAAGKPAAGTLARIYGDMPMCPEPDTSAGLTRIRVVSKRLVDVNGDRVRDLLVTVQRSHVGPSTQLDARVRGICKGSGGLIGLASVVPPMKTSVLQFASGYGSFSATSATQRLLDKWQAESPDGFNGLDHIGPPDL
ncbi:MAG: hypothetical protein KC776_09080 [Myxococcales bacterium]|nr:hypothetical protein [Myxococcales bacterium]MCB9578839.1 hypothetical protein [Polyangiaceae bacterium]